MQPRRYDENAEALCSEFLLALLPLALRRHRAGHLLVSMSKGIEKRFFSATTESSRCACDMSLMVNHSTTNVSAFPNLGRQPVSSLSSIAAAAAIEGQYTYSSQLMPVTRQACGNCFIQMVRFCTFTVEAIYSIDRLRLT
jgi:hypothetical protein